MKIEDLSPYNYMNNNESVKSIGWLEGDFNKGEVDSKVIKLLETYERINLCRGFHCCEYCEGCESGNGEIWSVSKQGEVYAAPSLVIHYIKEHSYLPPKEFIDSVLNGLKPDTEAYKSIIKEVGKKFTPATNRMNHKEMLDKFTNENAKELSSNIDAQIIKDIFKDKSW